MGKGILAVIAFVTLVFLAAVWVADHARAAIEGVVPW